MIGCSLAWRYVRREWLVVLLGLAAGFAWFAWEAHDLGSTCGYRNGTGLPSFPVKTALVVLIGVPALATAVGAATERRSVRATLGLVVGVVVLAGGAIAVAEAVFLVNRHCFA